MRDKTKYREVGDRLELTRLALGYPTQTEFLRALAQPLGDWPGFEVTFQRWNNYERGRQGLTPDVALALCARFDLSMDWLFRGKRGELPQRLIKALEAVEASRR